MSIYDVFGGSKPFNKEGMGSTKNRHSVRKTYEND